MNPKISEIKIIETKDYEIFNTLAKKFDLETSGLNDYFKAWVAISNRKNIGGISLKKRGKIYLLDIIAVDRKYQKLGLGKKLVLTLLEYLKKRKVSKLYVNTKVPEFFKKFNFKEIPPSKSPIFSDCWNCPQYNKTCFPVHMILKL